MATRIQAINAYRPRIDLGPTVQKDELVHYLADRTGLNEGEVDLVLRKLPDAVTFFHRAGRGSNWRSWAPSFPTSGLTAPVMFPTA